MTERPYFCTFAIALALAAFALCATDANSKPDAGTWIRGRHPRQKLNLISWLVDGCFYYTDGDPGVDACPWREAPDQHDPQPEYASFDGFYNNVFKADLGAVGELT